MTDPLNVSAEATADPTPSPPAPPAPPAPPTQTTEASYFEKLLAYIPVDLVAGFTAVDGIVRQNQGPIFIYWSAFAVFLLLVPLYTVYKPTSTASAVLKCGKRFQAVTATVAFLAWTFALGSVWQEAFAWYKPYEGSLVLIAVTLIIPVAEKIADRIPFLASK